MKTKTNRSTAMHIALPNFFHFKVYGDILSEIAVHLGERPVHIDYYSAGSNIQRSNADVVFSPIGVLPLELVNFDTSYALISDDMTLTTQVRSTHPLELIYTKKIHSLLVFSTLSQTSNRMVKHILLDGFKLSRKKIAVLYDSVGIRHYLEDIPVLKITIAQESLKSNFLYPYVYDIGTLWKSFTGHAAVYGVFYMVKSEACVFFKKLIVKLNQCLSSPLDKDGREADRLQNIIDMVFAKHSVINEISKNNLYFFIAKCIRIVPSFEVVEHIRYFYKVCRGSDSIFC